MATIKSYSDLEQSKKLAEILPLESADMWYEDGGLMIPRLGHIPKEHTDTEISCWSLSALLSVLPYPSLHKTFSGWCCDSYNKEGTSCIMGNPFDDPIDTCYEMILMLYELKIL